MRTVKKHVTIDAYGKNIEKNKAQSRRRGKRGGG